MRFDDDSAESAKTVKQWNVKIISISRNKRHQDRAAALDVSERLEEFMRFPLIVLLPLLSLALVTCLVYLSNAKHLPHHFQLQVQLHLLQLCRLDFHLLLVQKLPVFLKHSHQL
ncbi:uncharacterized protein LOC141678005 isoform X2 [Apium graveolens]|uniref:uncharacterized protein LOC141678005 isoform X2 n=1 Tax=Apium graveolens TaxID=4045 RepID=UPI003D7A4274